MNLLNEAVPRNKWGGPAEPLRASIASLGKPPSGSGKDKGGGSFEPPPEDWILSDRRY
jgi:hypothetical protein